MINSPFMKPYEMKKGKAREKDYRNQGKYIRGEDRSVSHPYFNEFFQNRVGERVIKLARKTKTIL